MNQLSIPKAPAPMGWSPNIEDGLNTETEVGKISGISTTCLVPYPTTITYMLLKRDIHVG